MPSVHGVLPSMNGASRWYDSAPMGSFFGTLKSEWVHHRLHRTRDQASLDVFYCIEVFYNRRWLHSWLGHLSPEVHKQLYHRRSISA